MPPVVITNVMASASSQTKALLPRMLLMFDQVGNVGESAEASAATKTSTANAPRRCTWYEIRSRNVGAWAGSVGCAAGPGGRVRFRVLLLIGCHAPGTRRRRSR